MIDMWEERWRESEYDVLWETDTRRAIAAYDAGTWLYRVESKLVRHESGGGYRLIRGSAFNRETVMEESSKWKAATKQAYEVLNGRGERVSVLITERAAKRLAASCTARSKHGAYTIVPVMI